MQGILTLFLIIIILNPILILLLHFFSKIPFMSKEDEQGQSFHGFKGKLVQLPMAGSSIRETFAKQEQAKRLETERLIGSQIEHVLEGHDRMLSPLSQRPIDLDSYRRELVDYLARNPEAFPDRKEGRSVPILIDSLSYMPIISTQEISEGGQNLRYWDNRYNIDRGFVWSSPHPNIDPINNPCIVWAQIFEIDSELAGKTYLEIEQLLPKGFRGAAVEEAHAYIREHPGIITDGDFVCALGSEYIDAEYFDIKYPKERITEHLPVYDLLRNRDLRRIHAIKDLGEFFNGITEIECLKKFAIKKEGGKLKYIGDPRTNQPPFKAKIVICEYDRSKLIRANQFNAA